jgi:hypothetical protein
MRLSVCSYILLAILLPCAARAQPASEPLGADSSQRPSAGEETRKAQAYLHFKAAIEHFDRQEWSAALAEFLASRDLYPTRAATKDAAICMRKEGRFDEAKELYERLLHDFPDLDALERQFVNEELRELEGSIGTVEVRSSEEGGTVLVDGRVRGTIPLAAPLQIAAGAHLVRVLKVGFAPFETRIDVAGRQSSNIDANLAPLAASGRLRIRESSGLALDVLVDNVTVGRTPWEGSVAIGHHSVVLRGENNFGTQPVDAPAVSSEVTSLALQGESLAAVARVVPSPAGAVVSIDGVDVGRGVWEGRVRAGVHLIEVGAEGFRAYRHPLTLDSGERVLVDARLERDPNAPLWARRPRILLELSTALGLVPLFGGDVLASCAAPCSQTLPFEASGVLRVAYEVPSGAGLSVDAGYMALFAGTRGRATQLQTQSPVPPAAGTVDDALRVSGLTLGGSVFFAIGESWPITFRLGAGALLATARDERTGNFKDMLNQPVKVDVALNQSAIYAYVAPEVSIGRRISDHLQVSLGLRAAFLASPQPPRYPATPDLVLAGADGYTSFASSSPAGSFLIAVGPVLGASYRF